MEDSGISKWIRCLYLNINTMTYANKGYLSLTDGWIFFSIPSNRKKGGDSVYSTKKLGWNSFAFCKIVWLNLSVLCCVSITNVYQFWDRLLSRHTKHWWWICVFHSHVEKIYGLLVCETSFFIIFISRDKSFLHFLQNVLCQTAERLENWWINYGQGIFFSKIELKGVSDGYFLLQEPPDSA